MSSAPVTTPGMRAVRAIAAALALLLLAVVINHSARATETAAQAPTLYRVYYRDTTQLAELTNLDIWEHQAAAGYVLIAGNAEMAHRLGRAGLRVVVDEAATAEARSVDVAQLFAGGYRTVSELYQSLDALAAAHPQLATIVDYGDSYCKGSGGCTTPGGDQSPGYDLRALRITNTELPGSSIINGNTVTRGAKPVLFVMAAIHSREITTPELAMRLAEQLLIGYGVNADLTWIVDQHEVWIVPTANPDGHWIVELGALKYGGFPFYHRKNANRDANNNGTPDCSTWPPSSWSQYGIDLNRNHSFMWGPPGSSAVPCDLTYRGPSPTSEPETIALEALISSLYEDQRGPDLGDAAPLDTTGVFITLHSYGEFVLWPWGFPDIAAAPNIAGLKAIGDKLATFSGAKSCQANDPRCLYGANGATDDWAYGVLGVPAYTFEIGNGFMPAYQVIDADQWPRFGPSLVYAAKIAAEPYRLAFGPDAVGPTFSSERTVFRLNVTITDANNGGRPIHAAAYSIDVLPTAEGAVVVPLSAVDGTFDEVEEKATATLSTTGLAEGRHLVYVRGQDADGHWGPPTAAFLDLPPTELTYRAYMPSVVGPAD